MHLIQYSKNCHHFSNASLILHERESQNFLDVVVVSQEHDQSIYTHSPATGRWKTIFQSSAESFVDKLGFIIAL